jgi:DNA polymerase-1
MAALPPPGADDVLYLVDISGWIHRAFHALPPLTGPSGEPTGAVSGVAGMLVRLLDGRRPAYLAVATDPPGPSFRQALFPGYKAARPPLPPDLEPQIARVRQLVEAHRIPILEAPELEADDVIAAAARRALDVGLRVVIVAQDKDLSQLVGDRVIVWDGRDRVLGPEEVRARWGVGPEQLGDLLALAGDATDGVPGIPGVGAKTAAALLAKRGSLAEVLRKADWEPSPALRAKLRRHAEDALLSRRLVELRTDAPVRFDLVALRVGWGDPAPIRTLYEELGMPRLASEVTRLDKAPVPLPLLARAAAAEAAAEAAAAPA